MIFLKIARFTGIVLAIDNNLYLWDFEAIKRSYKGDFMFLLQLLKEKRQQFFISIGIVLLIHMLKFTNYYPNWDSIWGINMGWLGQTFIGRWFSGVSLRLLHSPYDLQLVEGIISAIFIALSAILILEIFEIRKPLYVFLATFLFAAFPSMASTFTFMFWAPTYMLALLMAVLATYLCIKDHDKKTIAASTLLFTFSLGIYQIYWGVAFIIFFYFLANNLLNSDKKIKDYKNNIIAFALSAGSGAILYLIILKAVLFFSKTSLGDYQGVSQSGLMSFSDYIDAFQKMLISFNEFFFGKSFLSIFVIIILGIGLISFLGSKKISRNLKILVILLLISLYPVANALWFLFPEMGLFGKILYFIFKGFSPFLYLRLYTLINIAFALLITYLIWIFILKNKDFSYSRKFFLCLLFASALPLTYSMYFASPGVEYHSVMELGNFFIYFTVLMFLNKSDFEIKAGTTKIAVGLFSILCFYHFVNDNIAYKQMEMSYQRTSFETAQILYEIEKVNENPQKCVALIGNFSNCYPQLVTAYPDIHGACTCNFLHSDPYYFLRFSEYYFGRTYKKCSKDKAEQIQQLPEFAQMPEYPRNGYVKIIDDAIVVKLHQEQ